MALKDWKKIGKGEWYNLINKYKYVIVWKPGILKKERDKRGINTYGVRTNSLKIFFKTKSEALKFAKSYMRTH